MIRVLVVDDAATSTRNIDWTLRGDQGIEACGIASDGNAAIAMTRELRPDVVLMDLDLQRGDGLRATQVITRELPGTAVVVMGLDDDSTTLRMVSDAGARDYLLKPFGADELLATVRGVMEHPDGASDGSLLATVAAATPASAGARVAPTARPGMGNQSIAVVAGKGGVGTSALAANLALIASSEGRKRAAIVDLDLQHGDIRRMLRIEAPDGVLDVAAISPTAEPQILIPRLIDGPAGVMALLAPPSPKLDADITPEFAEALVAQLRNAVDVAFFDVPAHLTKAGAAVLRSVDRIVVVSSMSDPGVRATQGLLSLLASLGIPQERIILTLNRNEANSDLSKAAVEDALGFPVAVQLPYDPILVSTAINRGAPFVLQRPDAQVSRKVRELASMLVPLPVVETHKSVAPNAPRTPYHFEDEEDPEVRRKRKKKGLFSFGKV